MIREFLQGEWPLHWEGVSVTDIRVIPDHGEHHKLRTFFSKRKFDLPLGLAFKLNDTQDDLPDYVPVCATHMDHEEFSYEIHLVIFIPHRFILLTSVKCVIS